MSVLTPVLNEEAELDAALRAMLDQSFDGALEYLFIDGGSVDGTVDILAAAAQADPRVRILTNPDRSTPIALNIGLRAARGTYVARMDAHTRYPPTYLADGVARLEHGDVAHVSGPQLPVGYRPWARRAALALRTPLGSGGAAFRRKGDHEIEVDSGFTGVWRRATLERHGGWDEAWPNDQDSELAARITAEGGRIVCLPSMAAEYVPRDGLPALSRQYWRYGRYRAKTFVRHPAAMRPSHVATPTLALAVLGALLPLGPVTRVCRAAVASYVVAVLGVSVRQGSRPDIEPGDALTLPAVFAAMHLPHGFGFLSGCARYGPPLAALQRLLRSNRER